MKNIFATLLLAGATLTVGLNANAADQSKNGIDGTRGDIQTQSDRYRRGDRDRDRDRYRDYDRDDHRHRGDRRGGIDLGRRGQIVRHHGRTYKLERGQFYVRSHRHGWHRVDAPIGITVPRLPYRASYVRVRGERYATFAGVFYERCHNGYEVVRNPYHRRGHWRHGDRDRRDNWRDRYFSWWR